MDAVDFIFWFLLFLLFYSYIGYALIVFIYQLVKKPFPPRASSELPAVTLVIASYNEGSLLPKKLRNTFALDYPLHKLSVLIVTDGSTDDTLAQIAPFPQVLVLHRPERKGKTAAINRAMHHVKTPVVVFSDANTLLNKEALQKLVRHFDDEKAGAVAGEKKVAHVSGMGSAEGWYWKYESYLKKLDASFYTVVAAAGELFAIRTPLFTPLKEEIILDDFMISMQVCMQGYTLKYEPEAYAIESPSVSLADEEKRKVRIAAGAYQALGLLSFPRLFSMPKLAFQFLSRRWLRWVICPVAVGLLFISNVYLSLLHTAALYDYLFAAQLLFYAAAFLGWVTLRYNKVFFLTTIPFYFLFMNYCMLKGLYYFSAGKQTAVWTKAARST